MIFFCESFLLLSYYLLLVFWILKKNIIVIFCVCNFVFLFFCEFFSHFYFFIIFIILLFYYFLKIFIVILFCFLWNFLLITLYRSFCPDRTIAMARKYITHSLGPLFAEPVVLNLEATWLESEPRTPLVCFLSMGSDPTNQIEALSKKVTLPFGAISMGQGQDIPARSLIRSSLETVGAHHSIKLLHSSILINVLLESFFFILLMVVFPLFLGGLRLLAQQSLGSSV